MQINIPTPLRTIRLRQDADIELSPFEEKGLEKYKLLHGIAFHLLNELTEWHDEAAAHMTELKIHSETVTRFEREMKLYGEIAGHTVEETASVAEGKEYKLNPGELKKDVLRFADAFQRFYEGVNHTVQRYWPIELRHQEYEDKFMEFDRGYYGVMIREWERMALDICVLDDDFNAFREALTPLGDIYYKVLLLYEELPETYEALVQRVNTVYRRTDQLFATLESWQKIHEEWDEERSLLN